MAKTPEPVVPPMEASAPAYYQLPSEFIDRFHERIEEFIAFATAPRNASTRVEQFRHNFSYFVHDFKVAATRLARARKAQSTLSPKASEFAILVETYEQARYRYFSLGLLETPLTRKVAWDVLLTCLNNLETAIGLLAPERAEDIALYFYNKNNQLSVLDYAAGEALLYKGCVFPAARVLSTSVLVAP